MTKTNRNSHRIIRLVAVGSVALGAYTFGLSSSPGSTRGAGISTSPGRSVAAGSNIEKSQDAQNKAIISNLRALTSRKAGGGQHEY